MDHLLPEVVSIPVFLSADEQERINGMMKEMVK